MKIYAISYGHYKGCYNDNVVIPIQAGSLLSDTDKILVKDAGLINISNKNITYNELTAIYSIWQNPTLKSSFVGVCHYRRYFINAKGMHFFFLRLLRKIRLPKFLVKKIYTYYLSETTETILENKDNLDAIFPAKIKLKTSLREHYYSFHNSIHYETMMEVIKRDFPYLYDAAEKCSDLCSGYFFNMSIMKQELFNEYCHELFRFASLVEEELSNNLDDECSRYIGYLSERFSNFYFYYLINYNKISYIEMNVILIKSEVYL